MSPFQGLINGIASLPVARATGYHITPLQGFHRFFKQLPKLKLLSFFMTAGT
jgi:hypothetical protein